MIGSTRRGALRAITLLAALGSSLWPAFAQGTYPTKAVRIIVPSAPGDAGDVIARALAEKLSTSRGGRFFIDSRPGAGGRIGTETAARADPDGHHLLLANAGSHAINGALYKNLPFDLIRDFVPISLIASSPNVLVVNTKVPVKTLAEFIALARATPARLNYASGGNGTSAHLSMELLKSMAKVDMVHVPYKGAFPALTDIIAGEPPVMIVNLPPAMPHIEAGSLRAIAVTTAKRSAQLPDVPTLAEAGLPGYETVAWFGLIAPAGTPPDIVARLHAATVEAVAAPEMRQTLQRLGAEPVGGTPADFQSLIARDLEKWRHAVAVSGATVE